jgi:biopolymer transport protein ExbD
MIVLVPVLLLSLTLTHTRVIDLNLPWSDSASAPPDPADVRIEVIVDRDGFSVTDGQGKVIRDVPRSGTGYDYATLSLVMQTLKRELPEKRDVTLLVGADVSYQTLVSVMDGVRAYRIRENDREVAIELFPEISLGDAPVPTGAGDVAATGPNRRALPGDRT